MNDFDNLNKAWNNLYNEIIKLLKIEQIIIWLNNKLFNNKI